MNINDNSNLMENLDNANLDANNSSINNTKTMDELIKEETPEIQATDKNSLPEVDSVSDDKEQVITTSDKPIENEAEQVKVKEVETKDVVSIDYEKIYDTYNVDQLVDELELAIKGNEDINNSVKTQIGYIKLNFTKKVKEIKEAEKELYKEKNENLDGIVYSTQQIEDKFKELFALYKEKKIKSDKKLEEQKIENLAQKRAIIDELKQLINNNKEDSLLKKTYDDFHALRAKWTEIGPVPQTELNDLWHQYNYCIEQFFDFVNINKELKELDLKKNLEQKIELVTKLEGLLIENSYSIILRESRTLIDQWRKVGPVPRDKKEEIEERFIAIADKINLKKNEYIDSIKVKQENNYNAKIVLCEKVEELADMIPKNPKSWNENTEKVFEIQKMWKTLGRANREQNEEIWNRFRVAIDRFFANKKDFYDTVKEMYQNNYNAKLNLCVLAEGMKDSTNWKKTTDDIIKLQEEWKKIGPVDIKVSDKIWKRFRAACDVFFNNKAEYFKNITSIEKENYEKKLEIIKRLEGFQFAEDATVNLEKINELQNEWMGIGYIPIEHKEELQKQYRGLINKIFEELKASNKGIVDTMYKNKMQSLKESQAGHYKLKEEKSYIIKKINDLKNDITLWENNIGFFVNSKGADKLLADFEAKINNAKQELARQEEKLKILNKI